MKLLKDYTSEQLEVITNEEVETIIKYECLEEGVALLPKKEPAKPIDPTISPDITVYSIEGLLDYSKITLKSFEDASKLKEVLETITFGVLKYSNSYKYKYFQPNDKSIEIKPVKAFSMSKYQELDSKIKSFEIESNRYEERIKEYNKTMEVQNNIVDYVYSYVDKCREHKYKRDDMLVEFKEYLNLMNGDFNTSYKLFKRAYSDCDKYFTIEKDTIIRNIYCKLDLD